MAKEPNLSVMLSGMFTPEEAASVREYAERERRTVSNCIRVVVLAAVGSGALTTSLIEAMFAEVKGIPRGKHVKFAKENFPLLYSIMSQYEKAKSKKEKT